MQGEKSYEGKGSEERVRNGATDNSVRHTDCVRSVETSIDCKQCLSVLLAILVVWADSAIPSSDLL